MCGRKSYAAAGAADRADMMAAAKKEQDADADAIGGRDSGQRPRANGRPCCPNNEKSLTALPRSVTSLVKRDTRIGNCAAGRQDEAIAGNATETAKQSVTGHAETLEAALAEKLKDAITLWPANELANRPEQGGHRDER